METTWLFKSTIEVLNPRLSKSVQENIGLTILSVFQLKSKRKTPSSQLRTICLMSICFIDSRLANLVPFFEVMNTASKYAALIGNNF